MQARSAAYRFGILAALLLGWWWIHLGWWWIHSVHPQWLPSLKAWALSRPYFSDRAAAITGAALLAIFFALLMWGRFSPWRRRTMDSAMGEGCVTFAALGVAGLGVVLAVAWFFHIRAIIWLIALMTVLPAIQLLLGLIYEGVKSLRKKRQQGQPRKSSL
jgi:hypothetical protein